MKKVTFEWDDNKNQLNEKKHGVSFYHAQATFMDPNRVIAEDVKHNQTEKRYYCFGKIEGGIMTVRFTYRENVIRIIDAGYWRKGKKLYEQAHKNKVHKRTDR